MSVKYSEFRVGTGLYARYVTPPVACEVGLAPGDLVRLSGTVYRVVGIEAERPVPGAGDLVADRVTVDPAPAWHGGAGVVAYEWTRGGDVAVADQTLLATVG